MARLPLALALFSLVACAEALELGPDGAEQPPADGGADAAAPDGAGPDAALLDAEAEDALAAEASPLDGAIGPADAAGVPDASPADAALSDAGAVELDAGPPPSAPLGPVPGELSIFQLELPGGVTLRLGEAAVVVGPAGSLLLLDVGNSNHDDEVKALVGELNTAAGRPANQVEWIVLSHFHGDHIGAVNDLLTGSAPLDVTHGIVHRGFVDLGDGMNIGSYGELCTLLTTSHAALSKPLCHAPATAPCSWASGDDPFAADGCPGLLLGDLADPADDAQALPSFIDLDGARFTFTAADAYVSNGQSLVSMAPFAHADNNEENGRSLAGVLSYGGFRYHFGGDMTGSGDPGEPDVESHYVAVAGPAFYGELGVDVSHAHHHARRTSSNPTFVAALAPVDGRARNVVGGINETYVGSPYAEVLDHWTGGSRLGAGAFWVTEVAPGGASPAAYPALVVADGMIIIQTFAAGHAYWMQAAGATLAAHAFATLR